jgi:small-conductance mechanosensitive channel
MPHLNEDLLWHITERLIAAVIVVAIVGLIYFALTRVLLFLHRRGHISVVVMGVLRRVLFWGALATAIGLGLQALGVLQDAWAALTAILAMVAIGFVAVWSVLSNAMCSVILMITRPFGVGDQIELPPDNIKGTVVNFSLIFTTLRAEEGDFIQIPNNAFFQRIIRRRPGGHDIALDDQLMEASDADVPVAAGSDTA